MKKGLKYYLRRSYDRTYGFMGGIITVLTALLTLIFVKSIMDPDTYGQYIKTIKKFK